MKFGIIENFRKFKNFEEKKVACSIFARKTAIKNMNYNIEMPTNSNKRIFRMNTLIVVEIVLWVIKLFGFSKILSKFKVKNHLFGKCDAKTGS